MARGMVMPMQRNAGVAAIAVAVVVDGHAVAAVSCAMPKDRMTDEVRRSTIELVRSGADRVGTSLSRPLT